MLKPALNIQLPRSWPAVGRSAMLQFVSLAKYAVVYTRSWAADNPNARVRLRAERDRSLEEVGMLREGRRN